MKKIMLIVAMVAATTMGLFAQANCNATAPLIQINTQPFPVVCNGTLTPTPVLADTGSVLPNLEYVLVNNSRLLGGSPAIVASNNTGVFDFYAYDGIENGDEVCVIPVRFNIAQVRDLVDKIINGSYSPGVPCCNLIESLLDNVCEEFSNYGVTGAQSVTDLNSILTVAAVLYGDELTVDRFVETIGILNQNGVFLPAGCGGGSANIPVCFAVDGSQKACYYAGFVVDVPEVVYIDSVLANGNITVLPMGGMPTHTYAWSSGQSSATLSNLAVGSYTVTITDGNGCAVTETIEVLDSCALLGYTATVIPVSCFNGNDAIVQLEPIGGTPNYVVAPQTGSAQNVTAGNRATFISLPAGIYSFTVSDNGGCATPVTISIPNPDSLTLRVEALPDTLNLDVNDTLFFVLDTVFGGDFPLNLLWDFDNGKTSSLGAGGVVYDTPGTFEIELTARDARNCSKTFTHTLTVIGTVGIKELVGVGKIDVYPNPTDDGITVRVNQQLLGNELMIYNLEGKVVYQYTIRQAETRLVVGHLPNGVYTVKVDGSFYKLVVAQ